MRIELTSNASENSRILQNALDNGGDIFVAGAGTYPVDARLVIKGFTNLRFGSGVFIVRVCDPALSHTQFIINKGAFTGEYDHNIVIDGLYLITDKAVTSKMPNEFPGLRGHLGFINVKNMQIRNFDCHDLAEYGYGIQICDFENILLENLFIEGDKDGVHLTRGSKFTIRHSKFRTYDDPIALNSWDYCLSNARFGWLEDGLIEDCYDLDGETTGFFSRLIGGTWCDWYEGMEVQNSTTAVYDGIVYSANMPVVEREEPLRSYIPPTHKSGFAEYDGIVWRVVQPHDGVYNAGCRRITFRDIYMQKKRNVGICFELSTNPWAWSVPGDLTPPFYSDITFDNIHCCENVGIFVVPSASCSGIRITNSYISSKYAAYFNAVPGLEHRNQDSSIIISDSFFSSDEFSPIEAEDGRKVYAVMNGCMWKYGTLPPCKGNIEIVE